MKILLVAINSKYSHTNIALRYIKNLIGDSFDTDFIELTVNQSKHYILSQIHQQKPDVICFSCYIWNVELIRAVAEDYKKIVKDVKIIVGGPEVSYESEKLLEQNPYFDYIYSGQVGTNFLSLLSDISKKVSRETIIKSSYDITLNQIDFAYYDLEKLEHNALYYESSRGCPFSCSYCLSSAEKGVEYRDLKTIKEHLNIFLKAKVKRLKFVDRTFNANKTHALNIWKYLIENDNGFSNFHFEIAADLLDDECLEILRKAPPHLFQFEIGIQTTNEQTLVEISRKTDLKQLFSNIASLRETGNIHLHVDLIAGLPFEDYETFGKSFDETIRLNPHKLQLGFLKVLKGCQMKQNQKKYQLEFSSVAPYEILSTKWLSFEQIIRLKKIEKLLDNYYNSKRFENSIVYLMNKYTTPFKMFEQLSLFFDEKINCSRDISKEEYVEVLFEFCEENEFRQKLIEDIQNTQKWGKLSFNLKQKLKIWQKVYNMVFSKLN